jgi:MFS family permease
MAVYSVVNTAVLPSDETIKCPVAGTTSRAVDRRPSLVVVVVSFAIVAVVASIAWLLWKVIDPSDFVPRSDYTALAGVVLLATGIERLLEPLSRYLLPADDMEKDADENKAAAVNSAADPAADSATVETAAAIAANAIAKLRRRKSERAILFWAISTSVAMVVAAVMGVFFLRVVSASTTANRFVDLVATGLIVGAGTKPTHDLISRLEASKTKTKTDDIPEA